MIKEELPYAELQWDIEEAPPIWQFQAGVIWWLSKNS
jgi:hypothetical protein